MFDLFRRRDKAVRIMLGGLLGMVALSMLVYLIPGSGMPTGSRNEQVVAHIGKDQITTRDVDRLVQERIRGRQVPAEMIQYVIPQYIDQMVGEQAVGYEAKRLGFEITDTALANSLRSTIGDVTPDQYRMSVEQMGYSVPEFESNMRKRMLVLALLKVSNEGVVVTTEEVRREFNRRNEKIKLEYISFDPAGLQSEVKSTPQELQTFFNSKRAQFTMPETRTFELIVIDPQKVAESIQVSDAQISQYYGSHRDQFRTPERVEVRHILLSTAGKPKEETAKIQAKAEGLLKQIKAGGDFAELAKQNSDDPGSKANGGDLGWVVRGQTVKNFETAAFTLKPNQISDLITTEYGFHIIQVLEKQDARLEPLNEAKNRIADELKKGSVNERMQVVADEARAELSKAPKSAEQIAAKLGVNYVKVDKHKPGDPMPVIGADKQVDDGVATLKKGEVSPVLQAGTRLVVAELDEITAARPAEFAEVEPQVRQQYQQEKAVQLTGEKANKAAELVKNNGGDLKAAAKTMGTEVKSTDFFGHNRAAEGIGSASYFADAFVKPVGSGVGPVSTGTKTVVAKVVEKQAADPAKLAADRDGIVAELKSKKQEEREQLFEDSVLSKLIQEGKVKIHRD